MNERSLRISGIVRGALITYGIAAFSWLFSRALPAETGANDSGQLFAIQAVGIGLALQIALVVVRAFVKRYERAHAMEGQLYPQALFVFELLADGITVLLFAMSTFRAVTMLPAGV
jgi:hypothetical protein